MSSRKKTPRDQPVRDRLVREFDNNLLVEAGAGSGKTYSLAARMAAGIAAGTYRVEQMAAVTFTRKAAAELRGRFRLALEARLGTATSAAERDRLEAALTGIERLFAGTIHAFCAHLLRERPIDADMAPGFVELDDVENLRRQQQAWRDYAAAARASGSPPMLDLLEAGVRPKDLYAAFAHAVRARGRRVRPGRRRSTRLRRDAEAGGAVLEGPWPRSGRTSSRRAPTARRNRTTTSSTAGWRTSGASAGWPAWAACFRSGGSRGHGHLVERARRPRRLVRQASEGARRRIQRTSSIRSSRSGGPTSTGSPCTCSTRRDGPTRTSAGGRTP